MVSNVEPPLPPPRQTSQEFIGDVLLFHPLPQLEHGTTNFIHGTLVGLWLEMEEVAKEVKVGFYQQEGFIEMVEVMKLKAIIEKKAPKEMGSRKG
jgi:hypothetical protein